MTAKTSGGLLFVLLVGLYLANTDVLPNYDSFPAIYQSVSLLQEGDLSFQASEVPFMFVWRMKVQDKWRHFRIKSWNPTLEKLFQQGTLQVQTVPYFLMRSKQPGTYVNIFGFGAAVTATPLFAALSLFVDDLSQHSEALWYAGKLAVTLMVAGSAVVLFFIALQFLSLPLAWLCALTYGLGTCVWSTSSQNLWQHGPNALALMLGVFFLLRIPRNIGYAALCGIALAWATICRPTSAIVVLCVALYLLVTQRKACLYFVLAGLPFAVGLGWYNYIHFGAPWTFGQSAVATILAQEKTGAAGLWQTPLWEGLLGHLFSPSRGLLVYSPWIGFLLLSPWLWQRRDEYRVFWALIPALLLILGVESMHFDWWGGNSFGYRHIVDLTVFFALLLIPTLATISTKPVLRWIFLFCVLWSIGIQVLGAFAYNGWSWNDRPGFLVQVPNEAKPRVVVTREQVKHLQQSQGARLLRPVVMDIDRPPYRYRLWTLRDSQIVYYLTHFTHARQQKHYIQRKWHDLRGNRYPAPWLNVQ